MATEVEHTARTHRSEYRYIFTAKHHGGGASGDARWPEEVSHDEEFSVFDVADLFVTCDERGWLYGVLPDTEGELRDLGTWQQQMAEFPWADEGVPWHGYPIWAVNELAPPNRADQRMRPSKDVFRRMEQAGLITARQRKRLYKGDHV